jgi:hypothetical protein
MERFEYSDNDTLEHLKNFIVEEKMTYEEYIQYMILSDCWKVIVLPEDGDENITYEEDEIFDNTETPHGYITIYDLYTCSGSRENEMNEQDKRNNFMKEGKILKGYKEVRLYMHSDVSYIILAYGGDEMCNIRIYKKET